MELAVFIRVMVLGVCLKGLGPQQEIFVMYDHQDLGYGYIQWGSFSIGGWSGFVVCILALNVYV